MSPEDYDPLRERVRDALLDLTDPTSGRRLVRSVHWPEEIYHGPFLEQAADLLVEWQFGAAQEALCYRAGKKAVIIEAPKWAGSGKRWSGSHRSEGILIAWGPNIKQGATVGNATLYDIAPTVLYLQDHPVPRDMDGKVLTGVLAEEHVHRHPVRYGEPSRMGLEAPGTVLDAREARKIEERLRGLGYIE